MNKEYTLYFNGSNGWEEVTLGENVNTIKQAIKASMWFIKRKYGTEYTIKQYEDSETKSDLIHQWDYKDKKWKQYE